MLIAYSIKHGPAFLVAAIFPDPKSNPKGDMVSFIKDKIYYTPGAASAKRLYTFNTSSARKGDLVKDLFAKFK